MYVISSFRSILSALQCTVLGLLAALTMEMSVQPGYDALYRRKPAGVVSGPNKSKQVKVARQHSAKARAAKRARYSDPTSGYVLGGTVSLALPEKVSDLHQHVLKVANIYQCSDMLKKPCISSGSYKG